MKPVNQLVATVLVALILPGCGAGGGSGSGAAEPFDYVYEAPPQFSDGWLVSSLDAEGVNAERLTDMMRSIHAGGDDDFLRNIVIIKNNRLVFEEYFGGYNRNTLSHLQSATKSVVSAIYGIAETNGLVGASDSALFSYFPEYQHLSTPEKAGIRIQHVLTMTPGFDWNEASSPTFDGENDNIAAYGTNNYIEYVLQKPLVTTPGSEWNYNSGCPMLLAGIIKNQTGMHIDEFGDQYLLEPLGISDRRWEYQADGLPLATGGLWLKGRAAAKFGQLFLDGGRWNGQQLIPADWVDRSLTAHTSTGSGVDYGYLWWTQQRASRRIWYAAGYGGQLIVLVPERAATVVMNASYTRDTGIDSRRRDEVWSLLTNYILPAI